MSSWMVSIAVTLAGSAGKSVSWGKRVRAMGFGGWRAGVEGVPDLFGQEGHERAEEAECGLKGSDEGRERGSRLGLPLGEFVVQAKLHDFQIPVAEIAPEELVNVTGCFVEAVIGKRGVDGGGRLGEAGLDPERF